MAAGTPNLLIVHTDQQSCWTLGSYGGGVGATPNIDRLAARGALFSHFFTNSAVCTPSRGCFMTGRYPHCHGAWTNNIPLNRDEITFAELLRRAGYRTGYAGKWHLDGTPRPGWVHPDRTMGFDNAEFMFNRGHWKKIEDNPMNHVQPGVYPYSVIGDERTYTTDWLTSKAIEFVEAADGRPFCFMLSLPDPHGPVDVRPPYDTMFVPEDMPIPASFCDDSLPDWARALQKASPFGMDKPDREERLRRFLALYFGEVKLIDDSVGRMVDALEVKGVLENTLLVFTTDHGEYAGEHGLHGKNHLYETAYRIPMIMHWPDGIEAGTVVDNVMSTVDFQPTILSLLGSPASGREQGRDGSRLLGGDGDWDDTAFIHHSSHNFAGVFTPRYELALARTGDSVLFDRRDDPAQMLNLFGDPAHRGVVESLTRRIALHHADLDSPASEWLDNRTDGHGG
ncbi:sulfatase-like hydrolase/transferase [Verrucomicrobiota bacterium]